MGRSPTVHRSTKSRHCQISITFVLAVTRAGKSRYAEIWCCEKRDGFRRRASPGLDAYARPRDPGRGSWGAMCSPRERGSVSVVKKYSSTTSAFLRLVAEDDAALKGATQPTGNPWASPTSNRCDLTCPVAPPLTERQGGADSMGDTTTARLRGRYRRAAS